MTTHFSSTPIETSPISLPQPDCSEIEHSKRVIDFVNERITQRAGAIDFADYMHIALYEPELGYYVNGLRKFGDQGDFVTAPELGGLFGLCLAEQGSQILESLGEGGILEFGAGTGILAAQVLLRLDELGVTPDHYYILEVSPELRERQRQTLEKQCAHLLLRVEWISGLPESFTGVVIANEVVDAMPVNRFVMRDGEPKIQVVACENKELFWRERASMRQNKTWFCPPNLPEGYTSETHEQSVAWVKSLGDFLKKGVILIIDYGYPEREYYHPQRAQGTLRCHYRQNAHDNPFYLPGLQDITAHVNFTALAQAAVDVELDVIGYGQQAPFLMSLGLLGFAENAKQTTEQQLRISYEIKKLTLPSGMGELFKVLALGREFDQRLNGFELQNHKERL